MTDSAMFFGGPKDPQEAANESVMLQDYLNRWSAYLDIKRGGNSAAATSVICRMIFEAESAGDPTSADAERLWPLATWIEDNWHIMSRDFPR